MQISAAPQFTRLQEARRLLQIAGPLMAAYLAEYAMFMTTKYVVGSLGFHELATVGLAGSLAFEAMVVIAGLLSVTAVLAAQAEGAGRKQEAGHAVRQGLIVATVIGAPFFLFVWNLDAVFRWTGQDEAVTALAAPFAQKLAFFVFPVLWFIVFRDFVAAISRTGAVMAIATGAIPINWVLCEGLVHGRFGLPEMGIAGSGLAISIVQWLMFFALLAYVYFTPALRGYGVFRARLRVDPKVMREIVLLGAPIAGLVAVEAGMFTVVGLLSGVIGAEMLAAHQVLMAWIGIPFMIALALAEGSMVRVAHGVGRGDPVGARRAGFVGLAICVAILTALVAAPLLLAEEITRIFVDESDPGFTGVSGLVTQIIVVAAVFQVFDGAQVIMARSLRGMRDAVFPLLIGAFGYWMLGIGGGVLLAFGLELGGFGLWTGLAIGLIATAILLVWRFVVVSRRLIGAMSTGGDQRAAVSA